MRTNTILLASNNKGKLRELQSLLRVLHIECKPQAEYTVPEVKETGHTFIENSIIKARNACRYSGLPSIADDSGLEVDCLNGAPGILSARFAGSKATDFDNLKKLLYEVRKYPAAQRTARFQCAITYLESELDASPLIALGTWEGRIITTEKGENGFGYDPVFFIAETHCTSAELSEQKKNELSHRGQALRELIRQMRTLFRLESKN